MISESKRAYQKAYREKNRERLREYHKHFWEDNKERRGAENRTRYHANKKAYSEKRKAHYEANKCKIIQSTKAYHAAHPEVVKKSLEKYRRSHLDAIRKSKQKYSDAHKLENLLRSKLRRARLRNAKVDNRGVAAFYRMVRSRQSIPCYYCGKKISGKEAHIDHVVALSTSGNHAIENLCASCPTCNRSKSNKSLKEWAPNSQKLLPF